jgi:hypothetical protein
VNAPEVTDGYYILAPLQLIGPSFFGKVRRLLILSRGVVSRAYSQRLVRAQRLADPLSQLEEDFWRLLPFEGSVPIHFVSRADGVCVAEVAWQFPGRCPSWWDKSLEQAYVAAPWHPYIPPLRFLWLG